MRTPEVVAVVCGPVTGPVRTPEVVAVVCGPVAVPVLWVPVV